MSYSLAVANRTMHMRIVVLVPILLLCLEPAAFAATTTPTCTRELAAAETSLLKNARAPGQHRQGPSGRKMRRLPQTCRDRDQGARGVRPLHDEPGARDGYRSARRFPQGHLWRDRQELRRSVRTARKQTRSNSSDEFRICQNVMRSLSGSTMKKWNLSVLTFPAFWSAHRFRGERLQQQRHPSVPYAFPFELARIRAAAHSDRRQTFASGRHAEGQHIRRCEND